MMNKDLNQDQSEKSALLTTELERQIRTAVTAEHTRKMSALFSALPTFHELKELVQNKISKQNETSGTYLEPESLFDMNLPMKRNNGFTSSEDGWIENVPVEQAFAECLRPFYDSFSTALRKKIEKEVIKGMLEKKEV